MPWHAHCASPARARNAQRSLFPPLVRHERLARKDPRLQPRCRSGTSNRNAGGAQTTATVDPCSGCRVGRPLLGTRRDGSDRQCCLPCASRCSPDRSSRESTRTLCKHFTSVSPDMSGHGCQTDRAPMLVGTPLPGILSVFVALGLALWIRRVNSPERTSGEWGPHVEELGLRNHRHGAP